jgi:WD40 repeat protein
VTAQWRSGIQGKKVSTSKPAKLKRIVSLAIFLQLPLLATALAQTPKVEIVPITPPHMAYSVAFSPDGARVLSGGFDNTMMLWDVATGRLLRTFLGHTNTIRSVAFSPNGTSALSASQDSTMKLWDVSSGQLLHTYGGHTGTINSAHFSPDGSQIVSGSRSFLGDDDSVRLWDTATGQQLRMFYGPGLQGRRHPGGFQRNVRSTPGEVNFVVFSPDGTRIAGGSDADPWASSDPPVSGTRLVSIDHPAVRVWDAATGRLLQIFLGHSEAVNSIAFSADGRQIISASMDKTLKLWDIESGHLVRTFTGHSYGVTSVAFSPDGSRVLSGSYDTTLKLWEVSSGRLIRTFEGASASVNAVAFSPDGKYALSSGTDNALRLWDVATGHIVRTFGDQSSGINSLAVSPNGGLILSGGDDQLVKLWDVASARLLRILTKHTAAVQQVAFSANGELMLSGAADGGINIVHTAGGDRSVAFKQDGYSSSAAFSPDGADALYGTSDGVVNLLDLQSGHLTRKLMHPRKTGLLCSQSACRKAINGVTFSADGTQIATTGEDSTIKVWSATTGSLLRTFDVRTVEPNGWPQTVRFSPDGANVLSGDLDAVMRLWSVTTGSLVRHFDGHSGPVSAVAFSPDGALILSGSWDASVNLWDANTGRLIRTLKGHLGKVSSVAFFPDGTRAVTAGDDTTMKIWNLKTGELLATIVSARDDEWVIITPEGFFNASSKGSELLSIVRGLDVYAIDQLFQSLYRPDLVREKLAGDPQGKVKAAAAKLDLDKVIASGAAPQIKVLAPGNGTHVTGDEVTINAEVANGGGGIGRTEWRVNGVTLGVDEQGGSAGAGLLTLKRTVPLEEGENTIEVVAYNAQNLVASDPVRITVVSDFAAVNLPPRLYVLAIGVNDYWDSRLRLAFPVADAKALAAAFQAAGKGLYETVTVTSVLDQEVTRNRLDAVFSELAGNVRPRDVFVFFIAGHGKTVDGRYYFIPQNFRYDGESSIVDQGISQEQFQRWFSRIPAKKSVLLFDTCESGSLTGDGLEIRGLERVASLERLTRAMGRTVLSASTDDKPALEGYKGHGVFTYALLDALEHGDANGDGYVEVTELAGYVDTEVPDISMKTFNFRQVPQMKLMGSDFPLVKPTAVLNNSPTGTGPVIPPKPTHVVIQPADVFAAPGAGISIQKLEPGTLVALVRTEQGWMLVARDGNVLGYVAQGGLAPVH